jgi:hypothetical protein
MWHGTRLFGLIVPEGRKGRKGKSGPLFSSFFPLKVVKQNSINELKNTESNGIRQDPNSAVLYSPDARKFRLFGKKQILIKKIDFRLKKRSNLILNYHKTPYTDIGRFISALKSLEVEIFSPKLDFSMWQQCKSSR